MNKEVHFSLDFCGGKLRIYDLLICCRYWRTKWHFSKI